MPTIVACPKCKQQVTLPPDPYGGLICPHCQAEFVMQPVLRPAEQYSSLRQELAREVRQGAKGSRSVSDVTFAEVGDSVIALPSRRGPSGLAMACHFVGLVGGGALGLAVGYCLLTWLGGAHFNVLELPLPWIVPVAHSGAPDSKQAGQNVAGRPGGQGKSGGASGNAQAGVTTKPLSKAGASPALPTGPNSSDPRLAGGGQAASGVRSAANVVDHSVRDDSIHDAVQRTPSVEPHSTAWRDRAAVAAAENSSPRHTPAVAVAARQVAASGGAAPRFTAEELARAMAAAREALACPACKSSGYVVRAVAGRETSQRCEVCRGLRGPGITAEAYGKLCRLAVVAMDTATEVASTAKTQEETPRQEKTQEEIASLWRKAADRPEKQAAIGRHAAQRFSAAPQDGAAPQEGTLGILLVGTVDRKELRGAYHATRLVLLGEPAPVVVLSRGEMPCRVGEKVIVAGCLVMHPASELPGYEGPAGIIVRAGKPLRLEEQRRSRLEADPSRWNENFGAGWLLNQAAYRNLEPLIRYIVSKGVDVHFLNGIETPLHHGVDGRQWNSVELLLELGADINWGNGKYPTPLFTAVIAQDTEIAEKLIQKGAAVNASYINRRGQECRPLDFAELADDQAMIKLLKTHGGHVAPAATLKQPSLAARVIGTFPWVNRIWPFAKKEIKPPQDECDFSEGWLYKYIDRGAITEAKTIIRENPELLRPGSFGGALQMAARNNLPELVNFALDRGAEIDACESHGETALFRAVDDGHLEIVRILLERGADPNLGAGEKITAIFRAVWNANIEMVKLLLKHGADVNASFMHEAGYPRNALEAARRGERGEMYELLVQHGAVMPDLFAMIGGDPKKAQKIGYRLIRNEDYETAVRVLPSVIEKAPTAELCYQCGVAFDMLNKSDEAHVMLDQAIQLDPRHSQALYSRSLVFRKINRWADAKKDLEAAVAVDDDDFIVVNGLANLLVTAPDLELRDAKTAVTLATKACERTRWEDAKCIWTLAEAYRQSGDTAKAEEIQRRAIQLESSDGIFQYIKDTWEADILPNGLQEIVPSEPSISIWAARPLTANRNLIFTTGLSEQKLASPQHATDQQHVQFGELCMYLPRDWPLEPDVKSTAIWPMLYLRRLAMELYHSKTVVTLYPLAYPANEPTEPLAPDSEFWGVLLIPRYNPLSGFATGQGRIIEVITVMPVYAEEFRLARTREGLAQLLRRCDELNIGAELRPGRVNATLGLGPVQE